MVLDGGTSLEGRVAVVTGAGAGLGRAEAEALAAAGATVVLNDLPGAADEAAEAIRAAGGEARVVPGDVGERSTADDLMAATAHDLGRLDIVVNNAGVTRDRMLFNMSDEEWDTVLRIHLRGHFLLARHAASYWRGIAKSTGDPVYGRIVNTSSEAFLSGSPGQPNYAAAKAGITALTLSIHNACGRYGVKANAICPRARTAMTADVFGAAPEGDDALSADKVAPLVAYLASPAAAAISGQVFVAYGGMIALASAPAVEKRFDASGSTWTPEDLDGALGSYFADRDPKQTFIATSFYELS